MPYPLPGAKAKVERAELKGAIGLWFYPDYSRAKQERAFVWSAAFSDERITSRVGRVRDAHIERVSGARRSREAHERKQTSNIIEGTVAMTVIGDKGMCRTRISYRWNHRSGEHSITAIELSP